MRLPSSILTGLFLACQTTGVASAQDQKAPDTAPPKSQSVESNTSKTEEPKSRGLFQKLEKNAATESHKLEKNAATESHKLEKNAATESHKLGHKATEWTQSRAAATIAKIKASKAYKYLVERAGSLFMEEPQITVVQPEKIPTPTGSPVYYINGMLTIKAWSVDEAQALADDLGRTVYLIHNPSFYPPLERSTGTPTCVDDISEAIYDKLWPEKLMGVDLESLIPKLSLPNPPIVQLNPTTKQITWVLYHARGPVSIVSHSQGCLQVRNALFAAALLSKEGEVRHDVAWVATGTPLNDSEIYPVPAKYHYEINANDPVPAIIGIRGGPGDAESIRRIKAAAGVHDPVKNYFPRINKSTMLFP